MRTEIGLVLLCLGLTNCADSVCKPLRIDSEVPLMRLGGQEIAPVLIDGQPTGLVLDTGAAGTSVTPQAVQDLHLQTHTLPIRTSGIGGTTYSQAVELDTLRVGGAELSGAAALVIPLSQHGLQDFPVYGLLGEDLLTNWDVELDTAHDKLTLYEPQTCADPDAPWSGPAQSVGIPRILTGPASESTDISKGLLATTHYQSAYAGEILFPVTLDGHALTAQLDSGAATSVVRPDAVGLSEAAVAAEPTRHLMGVNLMGIAAHRHQFGNLQIGDTSYGPVKLLVGDFQLHGADMLLGEDFLRRHQVSIAFHAGKLLIAGNSE